MNTRFYLRRCGTDTNWKQSELGVILDDWYMCDVDADQGDNNYNKNEDPKIYSITSPFKHFSAPPDNRRNSRNIWCKIADEYQTSFAWQTWTQPSMCWQQACENNKDLIHVPIKMFGGNGNRVFEWERTEDHAKIGISLSRGLNSHAGYDRKFETTQKIVCWGDLNRALAQIEGPGGGYICAELPDLHFQLTTSYKLESCNFCNLKDFCPPRYVPAPAARNARDSPHPKRQSRKDFDYRDKKRVRR